MPAPARKTTRTLKAVNGPDKTEVPVPLTIAFEFDRETKNTRRYAEIPDTNGNTVVGTLYLSKEAAAKIGNPDKLTLTVAPGA